MIMDLSFVRKFDASEVDRVWVQYGPDQAEEALRDMAVPTDMTLALLSYCGDSKLGPVEFRTLLRSASFAKNAIRDVEKEMDGFEFFASLGGPKLALSKEESDVIFRRMSGGARTVSPSVAAAFLGRLRAELCDRAPSRKEVEDLLLSQPLDDDEDELEILLSNHYPHLASCIRRHNNNFDTADLILDLHDQDTIKAYFPLEAVTFHDFKNAANRECGDLHLLDERRVLELIFHNRDDYTAIPLCTFCSELAKLKASKPVVASLHRDGDGDGSIDAIDKDTHRLRCATAENNSTWIEDKRRLPMNSSSTKCTATSIDAGRVASLSSPWNQAPLLRMCYHGVEISVPPADGSRIDVKPDGSLRLHLENFTGDVTLVKLMSLSASMQGFSAEMNTHKGAIPPECRKPLESPSRKAVLPETTAPLSPLLEAHTPSSSSSPQPKFDAGFVSPAPTLWQQRKSNEKVSKQASDNHQQQPKALLSKNEIRPRTANKSSNSSTASNTLDEEGSAQLPPGWERRFDPRKQKFYYIDHTTRTTTWRKPRHAALLASSFSPKKQANGTSAG